MKSSDIITDDFIYARDQKSKPNIESLVEKLKAGIVLDPITVQMVAGYPDHIEPVPILLNGGHRFDAYSEYNTWAGSDEGIEEGAEKQEIQITFYSDEILDYETHKTELAIYAHNVNDEQGLNSRPSDTKKIARNICNDNPTWGVKEIGEQLHRSKGLMSKYCSDILQKRRASEHSIIMRLSCLGWTQEEIGKVIRKSQDTVSAITKKFNGEQIRNFFDTGKSVEQIGEMLNIDIQTVWHFLLKDKSDDDKFAMLDDNISGENVNPSPFDVANYGKCLPLMGTPGYAGLIPGQIVWNMLYYFTEPGDLVIDPMVGGGTTIDACLIMNRKCIGYDKLPVRPDIRENDITGDLPDTKKAQLVFYDPPYFIKKQEEYSLPEELRTKDGFMKFSDNWSRFAKGVLKPGGYAALLISDYIDYGDPAGSIFSDAYLPSFIDQGFERVYKCSYPLTADQYQAHDVTRSRETKQLLIRGRELHLMRLQA